ncbi:hypothetical protein [Cryobacterium sp. SO1]|uniref:hypothetical protein n=1 Tax=Cryobacterium sp. SO1 TaxID=1897061 RepID=UPI00102308A4|nr:hypothetical protein [Cryobacterium sp. SO1]
MTGLGWLIKAGIDPNKYGRARQAEHFRLAAGGARVVAARQAGLNHPGFPDAFCLVKGFGYPKKHPAEVRERAIRMTLDRLKDYRSESAACRDLAPRLNIGAESLRQWVVQAQVDAGDRTG